MEKIALGAQPYLYPLPTVIVGAYVDDKPNFLTVSFVGIVQQHSPPMVSVTLHRNHHTSKGIQANMAFSINIPNTRLLRKTDFIGMNSGKAVDKSEVFELFEGKHVKAPLIRETPINLECKLVNQLQLSNESILFIGEIVESYSSKRYLKRGTPYLPRLNPILFSINNNSYFRIGRRIGRAWKEGLKVRRKEKGL